MKKLLYFVTGAAVGSLVTWKLVKDKYEKIANEEIQSVKEALSNKAKSSEHETEQTADNKSDKLATEYSNIIKENHYTNEEEKSDVIDKPYMIDGSEFGLFSDYETITLQYFSDGVLTDDLDDPVDNPEEIVGDVKSYFERVDEDCVFVRNDSRKCDYEILKYPERYDESHF